MFANSKLLTIQVFSKLLKIILMTGVISLLRVCVSCMFRPVRS